MKCRLLLLSIFWLGTSTAVFGQANTGTFSFTGSMSIQREQASATLISGCNCPADGKVLVVGGVLDPSGTGTTNTADLYDPATGKFTPTGTLNVARAGQAAVLISGGKVLIVGAFDAAGPVDAEIYDPVTGTFSCAAGVDSSTGSCNATLVHGGTVLTATLLQSGKVLITGLQTPGSSGQTSNAAVIYDPSQNSFTCVSGLSSMPLVCNPSMGSPHRNGTATLLMNGTVLLAGGDGPSGRTNSAELYDPSVGQNGGFSPTGSLLAVRDSHVATLLSTGEVLITGGSSDTAKLNTAELYAAGAFSAVGNMTHVRFEHTATLLNDGTVLVAGGCCEVSTEQLPYAEIYNPIGKNFAATGSMNDARATLIATLLPNGLVLVAGGFFDATAELYTPSPAPTIASISPTSGNQGQTIANFTVNGTNFDSSSTLSFSGTGITINSYASRIATQIVASISIAGDAPTGAQDVSVTNQFGQTGTLPASFTVVVAAPVTHALTVTSTNPTSSVAITVSPSDNDGQGNGTTQFTRSYNNGTAVTMGAPATAGGNNFSSWTGCDSASGASCTVTMNADRTVTANFVTPVTHTLTVASTNPGSGVPITVSPSDNNSQSNGNTQFMRTYNNGAIVTLGALPNAGGNNFSSWTGCDTAPALTCTVTITGDRTVTANYVSPFPPPSISSISPTFGVQGHTITRFVVSGSNFQSGAILSFGGAGITVSSQNPVTATKLVAALTIAPDAPAGLQDVIVTNPGSQPATLPGSFRVVPSTAVLLVHGFTGSPTDFGKMVQLLEAANVLVADPFDYTDKTNTGCQLLNPLNSCFQSFWTIERLAGELQKHIQCVLKGLCISDPQFPNGAKPDTVDVIAHSMGGLITRAYIAGLARDSSNQDRRLPYNGKIRKLITVGTPNYGAALATWSDFLQVPPIGIENVQAQEMEFGSNFVWDLHEAWRNNVVPNNVFAEANILAVAGTACPNSYGDGIVSVQSAVLPIAFMQDNIRYVPYIHAQGAVTCPENPNPLGALIDVLDQNQFTFQIAEAFVLGKVPPTLSTLPPSVANVGLLLFRLVDKNTETPLCSTVQCSFLDTRFQLNDQRPGQGFLYPNVSAGTFTIWPLNQGSYTVDIQPPVGYKKPPAINATIAGGRPLVLPAIELTRIPALVVTQFQASCNGGQPSGITLTLTNQGLAPLPSTRIGFFLSSDSVFSQDDIKIGELRIPKLNPNDSSQPISLSVPQGIAVHNYLIAVDESDPSINTSAPIICTTF